MTSRRKVAKLRKMEVKKVLKQIDKYQIPYNYNYGGGYFIFSFGASEFNLHITFKQIPLMKFGIWKTRVGYEYFAECIPYIDKFKPTRAEFVWDSLEDMMSWVKNAVSNPRFYISELERTYCSDSPYFPSDFKDILEDHAKDLYRDAHNGFEPDEYEKHLKAFNKIISELDTKDYDIFWKKSDGFYSLYDVWFYVGKNVSNEQLNEFEHKLRDCRCFLFEWRPLPNYFFKHKNEYCWKIHPGNECLYFSQKKHLKTFNHPDKQ